MAAFLNDDRAALAQCLPGLDDKLAATELERLERPDSPAIEWFRAAGGPALLVPEDLGGAGVSLRDGLRVQRAIASRSPSLAVATTMHHFSVASMLDLDDTGTGMEWLLIEAIARNSLLVASGAAEGVPGAGIVRPQMTARREGKGLRVTGSKKPCSLSRSMDLLFATVRVVADGGDPDAFALVVVPRQTPGLEVRPFWSTPVLAGAESDEVRLTDVFVPSRAVGEAGPLGATSNGLRAAMVWFELLIAACYVGVGAALLERALAASRSPAHQLAELAIDVEGATLALEAVASIVDTGAVAWDLIGRALVARFAAQRAVISAATRAIEALGGGAYVRSGEVAYLHSAAHCLTFHPPSRAVAADSLVAYLRGERVDLA